MKPTPDINGDSQTFGMVGCDPKLLEIIETIRRVAPSDASILIEGESGTGKHLIAAAIHAQSQRNSGPFIRVNCAAIPPELLETELFGQKTIVNGADEDQRGLLETANRGTLLLDEIAQMPPHLQVKLFRVLQEHKFRRLEDELEIGVNFRVIVTTSRKTAVLLEEGLLKNDLYFCISTIKVKVPALRDRRDDIPLLAQHFVDRFSRQYGKEIRCLSQETVFRLLRYDWPGNIRELASVIERAVLFCSGEELRPESLPEEVQDKDVSSFPFVIPPLMPMEVIEREAILQTLARTSGNVKQSAEILRYPRPTFYRKLKKFGIKVDRD